MKEDINKKMNKLAKDANFIIGNPETLNKLKSKGLPIKKQFILYEDYLDNLFAEKRKQASKIIGKLPLLSNKVANGTTSALYEEIRETYAMGAFGATITLSIILLELGMKYKLFEKRKETNPKYSWDNIERINFSRTIKSLYEINELSDNEREELEKFNSEVRNPYIHYNIKKLVQGVYLEELTEFNIKTERTKKMKNVDIQANPHLWFSGKKFIDKNRVIELLEFCIGWTNKILSK